MRTLIFCVHCLCFLPLLVSCQRFQFRLDGAVDGTFVVNNLRFPKFPAEQGQGVRSPWRHARTLFVDRIGLTSTLTVDYDQLTETIGLANALSHLFEADDSYDYGLTAHLFTSTSTGAVVDPSNVDTHVLLHAASDVPAFLSANATEICITVAFKSETLQSNSVCSLSWPYDTVCIVGRSLDRRWFIGNKSVNVSYSIRPVSSASYCTVNYQDPLEATKVWHQIGKVAAPSITGSHSFASKSYDSHHRVELASSEVGHGRPQLSLLLPPRDTYFRAGDLLRLPVYLNPGNNLASLLIRVNASSSFQLSEMRLLHSDWRLSIISDSNNRVAVIRATADPTSNASAILGGPLLEYDFRVITQNSKNDLQIAKTSGNRKRSWASLDSFLDDVVVGGSRTGSGSGNGGTTGPTPSVAGLTWEVEMVSRDSAAVGMAAIDAFFRLDSDPVMNIIPVVKVSRVFNYAVLRDSIQRMPMWLYGFTTQSGLIQLWDGECISSDPDALKVESMCRYLYLDGSETRGSENVTITIKRRRLSAVVHLSVLFPELPLKVDISDVNLQLIRNFLVPAPSIKTASKNTASQQPKCRSHYQRASVRIFARFAYPSSGFSVDAEVTDWLRSIIRVVNSSVADYDGNSLVGIAPGQTLVQLITAAGQLIGSRPIVVTASNPVSITRLDALIADRIDITVSPSQLPHLRPSVADNNNFRKFNVFDVTATLRRISSVHLRGPDDQLISSPSRLFVIAHFSDGTYLDLATLPSNWYELSVQPAVNTDVAVPRVALFEVAKCRRQSVDEHSYSASTANTPVTGESSPSVIRIDGSELIPTGAEPTEQEADDQNGEINEQQANDATIIALGVLLGVLFVVLMVLVIVAFRRHIKTIVWPHFDSLRPALGRLVAFYGWAKSRVHNTRLTAYFITYVIQKPKQYFRRYGKRSIAIGINLNPRRDSFDEDAQSCEGEEFDEVLCEPASRPDHNWVWLSRETLEKHAIDTMRSHPLLPDATFRSLCCSSGGVGTTARSSPAVSTTGSNASCNGRLSTPLLKRPLTATAEDTGARLASSSTPTDEDDSEDSPTSSGQRTAALPSPCIAAPRSTAAFLNNLVPTVYTGSECSLRILPGQSLKRGSTAALQLMAPDGRLMVTAFASRTLDHHRRRVRGYQNQMQHSFLTNKSNNDAMEVHLSSSNVAAANTVIEEQLQQATVMEEPSGVQPNENTQLLSPSRDQVHFSSLRNPTSRGNSLNRANNNADFFNCGSSTQNESCIA